MTDSEDTARNPLVEVKTTIAFPSLEQVQKAKTDPKLPISKMRSSAYALKTITRLSDQGVIDVTFRVPGQIANGLKSGLYLRQGGVILQSDTRQVVHWLRESKKLSKLGNVLFQAVDIFSELALNDRLKQIQGQLDDIAEYVKARHEALMPAAHEALRHALMAANEEEKRRLLAAAEQNFQKAKLESEQFLKSRIKRIHRELLRFDRARVYNTDNARRIARYLNEAVVLSRAMTHCAQAQVAINEQLGNIDIAVDLKVRIADFLSAVGEYIDFLVEGEGDYSKLALVLQFLDDCSLEDLDRCGALSTRLKRLKLEDLQWLVPAQWLLRRRDAVQRFARARDVPMREPGEAIPDELSAAIDAQSLEAIQLELASLSDDLFASSGLQQHEDGGKSV